MDVVRVLVCAVVIVRKGEVVTCGNPARHVLNVRGDLLFALCERHDKRLAAAFPEMTQRTVA